MTSESWHLLSDPVLLVITYENSFWKFNMKVRGYFNSKSKVFILIYTCWTKLFLRRLVPFNGSCEIFHSDPQFNPEPWHTFIQIHNSIPNHDTHNKDRHHRDSQRDTWKYWYNPVCLCLQRDSLVLSTDKHVVEKWIKKKKKCWPE